MQTANLADIGVAIGTQRGVLYKQFYGSDAWNDATRVPLASASKMLAGVRIMQLADRGAIDLDAPVSTYLPEFTGSKGSMTMREMFSHTSGYGNDLDSPVLAFPITLAQDVAYIARYVDPPYPPPGAYFAYGGISMQVGGEVAEVQGGGNWESGWIEHVGVPLGITSIDWQGLGPTLNYRISGGAQASLADYSKVLAMLAGGGVGNGQRILSPLAIRTMNHDQTNGALLAYSPPGADGSHDYGIGAWIEAFSQTIDEPTISSIGKFGYTPWVDFGSGYWGVLMVHEEQARVPTMGERAHAALQDISAIVRPALDPSCALIETYDAIFHDGAEPPP
jgi:CubicO group peptidase (beta-lactamase class C family)